ncbi:hypothetical protein TA3x_004824 [Tundrisphaera sp. TA3]|uniref:hypothetical protein n=1 Tax=Tundrisphaera sp. TA3 TaxID=3435775 RepID=UPI003EBFD441
MSGPPRVMGFGRLRPLLGEINDLKRIRRAGRAGSVAAHGFARAWAALISGADPARVAWAEAASGVASARLGAIDAAVLADAGLSETESIEVLRAGVDSFAECLDPSIRDRLGEAVGGLPADPGGLEPLPGWVGRLADQPRAGATRPGHPRLILEPAESHADHCYVTAVYAVLVASSFDADPAIPFLAGLSHHLHNAELPDSGFAGEELLGRHLGPIMDRLTARAMGELPPALAEVVARARLILPHADTPEARAFHAADVLDRVLQMDYHARAAGFRIDQALVDLDLVHPGPIQAFHLDVLGDAGLLP